jgi:hypothetical protein
MSLFRLSRDVAVRAARDPSPKSLCGTFGATLSQQKGVHARLRRAMRGEGANSIAAPAATEVEPATHRAEAHRRANRKPRRRYCLARTMVHVV